ncbi:MAG TPA: hypothetical protein VFU11_03895 [Solirubrobacterales bacterium]|nr:hypothetical protein [Solirubrobacterales bacterium]
MIVATLMSYATSAAGLTAAAIAVGGFLAHVRPALSGADEQQLRRATVRGGIWGSGIALMVIVLSAATD